MAKKDEKLEAQQAAEAAAQAAAETQTPSETPNRDRWIANMRGKYGEDKSEEELYDLSSKGYDEEHDFAKQQRADIDAFTNSIKDYPELASFYSEAAQGNIGAAILNLGDLIDAYRSGEIDDAKYKEQVAARKKEADDAAAAKETEQAELAEQNRVFEEWCSKKGYDPEEWMAKAEEMLFGPMAKRMMTESVFDAIDKMINYDEDVEAAKVQGRNENIVTQRKKSAAATDGQVNGGSASAGAAEPAKPSRMSQIAKNREYARNL